MEKRITKDMFIGDILKIDMGLANILMESGMHCLGCPSSQGESIEMACMVHGMDENELIQKLNDYLEKRQ